ncbi:MAG: DEAD/DEAH box helicase [Actinomycetota bacterium]
MPALAADPATADLGLSPLARAWLDEAFPAGPTPAQRAGWPAIGRGENVLLCAPTGSGKTLAAFLVGLDRLAARPATEAGTRLLYISPLKALNYDIERNLRGPLAGLRATADRLGLPVPEITVGVRTGDTPEKERARQARTPPDVLITTPESLFLLLTSPTRREALRAVEAVIIDEVHAVAGTKRGSHLALSLERLEHLTGRPVQRIALSATVAPLDEVARYAAGDRPCTIVDAGARRPLALEVVVPLADMARPEGAAEPPDPVAGAGDSAATSVWPAIYPRLLELIEAHTTTLIFVNYRRLAERLALRLNELAEREVARSHHGSLARETRQEVEELLKAGELPCLVATSSLELGIDMGAIDLVIQVESPRSVARGLQRVGRAGHSVGATSHGMIFPKHRGDLVESAVVAERMLAGDVEPIRIPANALDVLAQQIVSICSVEEWSVDDLERLVRRAAPYRDLPRSQLEGVLDMLSGRYPSDEFAELRARITWDRLAGTVTGREGTRSLAVANAGTIPDRGLYGVHLADGSGRVGELDEEMVYEARAGQVFQLGASSWRIERITRDRVLVTPAPGRPGQIPFWRGEGAGRTIELGRALGAFTREIGGMRRDAARRRLVERHRLDARAADNLLAYLREQREATGVLPSDRTVVVERFRDEIGDWRLCVLTPFGARVHAPWALAIGARLRTDHGIDAQALWSDDGIILHIPDADDPPPADVVLLDPDEIEDLVVRELAGSALFAARFRENAGRALLIPRRRPGQRTPLWQQRLRAQALQGVATRYPAFPIVLETYRECLQDVFDVPGLRGLLEGLRARTLEVAEVETATGSPFAASLLFDYVAQYMYEGDAPPAELRAQALSLDRELLRELLGQEDLRELLDADAIAQVASDLRRRHADSPDAVLDQLRRLGDLTRAEVAADAALDELVRTRRATLLRVGGEERAIAAEDAGRYRDATGALPEPGLPAAFLEPVPDALLGLVRRYARTHGPFAAAAAAERLGVPERRVLDELERLAADGAVVQGGLVPGGTGIEWCDAEVLRRIRRATLAVLRSEVEAVPGAALARFLPRWQRIDEGGGAALERLRDGVATLQGLVLPVAILEADVLPRRVPGYRPELLDQLSTSGEVVWAGAGEGRVALYVREDAPLLGPPPAGVPAEGDAVERVRARLAAGPAFLDALAADVALDPADLVDALWRLVWAGEATNDRYAPVRGATRRAARALPAARPAAAGGRRLSRRRASRPSAAAAGRWSLSAPLFAGASAADRARAAAEILLERHGVVTRPAVKAEGAPGGFAGAYPELSALETVGAARRGYFVEGLGGAQFALPGALERLREARTTDEPEALVLAAADPAQPYGAALPWPATEGGRPARAAGAHLVLVDGEPALHVERGGRTLTPFAGLSDETARLALAALADAQRRGLVPRLSVERMAGAPVLGGPWEPRLAAAGFRAGPRRMSLG